jgi:hypothetical protein
MADQVQKVTIQLILQDLVSGDAAKVQGALDRLNTSFKALRLEGELNKGGGSSSSSVFGSLASFASVVQVVRLIEQGLNKALTAANDFEAANARLSAALGGNVTQLRQINDAAVQVAKSSTYAERDLTNVAQHLVERGVAVAKIPQAMQVVADTAMALQKPLDEVADQVAQTFGGVVPREIGRSVPALKNLSEAALRSGAALDVLGARYHGVAQMFLNTPYGKELAALRDIDKAWQDIGEAILPIEQKLLPDLAKEMQAIAEPFKANSLVGALDVLRESLAEIAGDVTGAFTFISEAAQHVVGTVVDGVKLIGAQGRVIILDVASVLRNQMKGAITDVAAEIDKLTAHLPAWLGGKTNLKADVQGALGAGGALDSALANARKVAADVQGDFLHDSLSRGFSEALGAAADARREAIAAVEKVLGSFGVGSDVQGKVDEQAKADKLQAAADKRQATTQQTKDAENDTSGLMQKELDELTKQIEVRQLRARATIDGSGPTGIKATGDADLAELKIQQAQELAEWTEKNANADQLAALAQVQALETTAKRVEVTKQLADAEIQELERAKAAYDASVEHNANLVKVGQITPLQGRQADTAALATYQEKVTAVNAAIKALLAQGVLSPEQAVAVMQQLTTIEEKTKEINSQFQQDLAEMGRAVNEGLVHTLTEAETKAKTLKQALKDLAKSLLTDLLNIENQHLVDSILGGGAGGDGKGGGQGGGGGLLGSLINSIFGKKAPTSPTATPTVTPAVSATAGSTPSTPGAGGGAGGFSLGGAFNSVGQGIGDVAQGAGNVIGGLASGIGSAASGIGSAAVGAASTAASGIGSLIGGLLAFFDTGGYTGDGHPSQIAGVVHRGEYVLNASTVRAMGGPGSVAFAAMNAASARGFPSMSVRAANLSGLGGRDVANDIARGVHSAVISGMKAAGPAQAVMHVGPEDARLFFAQHSKIHAQSLNSDPAYAKAVGKAVGPYTGNKRG